MSNKTEKLLISRMTNLPRADFDLKVTAFGFENFDNNLILEIGDITKTKFPLIRIHSECITSEVFGSLRCDCKDQLDESLKLIKNHGNGAVIYLRQEGRGIGLFNKIEAYHLQEKGYDTIEANLALDLEIDARDYELAALYLKHKKVTQIHLITNNNDKINQLKSYGIDVISTLKTKAIINDFNRDYIQTKITKLDHQLQ